jgi:hypothetical protein
LGSSSDINNAPGPVRREGTRKFFVSALILALVVLIALPNPYLKSIFGQPGIDLYQMWGVSKSLRSSGYGLGSPYVNPQGYKHRLSEIREAAADPNLDIAAVVWPKLDLDGTPLLYYVFGLLPSHYSAALRGYRLLEIAAFSLAVMLLTLQLSGSIPLSLILMLLTFPACAPAADDVMLANVDCIQLLLSALAVVAIGRLRGTHGTPRLPLVLGAMALLELAALAKPNVAGSSLLLALCLLLNCGDTRTRGIAFFFGMIWASVLIILPCAMFGTPRVWPEWLSLFSAAPEQASWGGAAQHNYSTVNYLAGLLRLSSSMVSPLVGAAAIVSGSCAIVVPNLKSGKPWANLRRSGRVILSDPHSCYAIGTMVLLALSPLVWLHYFVLYLPICFWLILDRGHSTFAKSAGLVSLLLALDAGRLFGTLSGPCGEALHVLAWVPAWLGLLDVLGNYPATNDGVSRRACRSGPAKAASETHTTQIRSAAPTTMR